MDFHQRNWNEGMTTNTEDEQEKVMRKSNWLHDRRFLWKKKDIIVYSACIINNKRNIMPSK